MKSRIAPGRRLSSCRSIGWQRRSAGRGDRSGHGEHRGGGRLTISHSGGPRFFRAAGASPARTGEGRPSGGLRQHRNGRYHRQRRYGPDDGRLQRGIVVLEHRTSPLANIDPPRRAQACGASVVANDANRRVRPFIAACGHSHTWAPSRLTSDAHRVPTQARECFATTVFSLTWPCTACNLPPLE